MELALAFYGQFGFHITYGDEHFAVLERDGVNIHLNCYVDAPERHAVCWIGVTNVDALYQQCAPTNAVCSPLKTQPWGFREFMVRDPFGNGILFAERIPAKDPSLEQKG
jgi:hypothetical protein